MVAVHTLPEADPVTGAPTLLWLLFGGHASALFAVLAGVAVAFMMGGRRPKTCRRLLLRARVGLLVRALLLSSPRCWDLGRYTWRCRPSGRRRCRIRRWLTSSWIRRDCCSRCC
ncbi:hypothetical protein M3D92_10540 [Micrococcus terreus]|nr:hypothetical protein [Micrococcus terreus]